MKVHDKTLLVYDIECTPNCFLCTLCNTESKGVVTYEVSERKNDITLIKKIFSRKDVIYVGYNNRSFDDLVIQEIFRMDLNENWYLSTLHLYNRAMHLIKKDETVAKEYSQLDSIDLLTMLFSDKLRVGLKALEVTMGFKNVQEFVGDFDKYLAKEDIDKLIEYNRNDVEATCEVLYKFQDDLKLRLEIEQIYGIQARNRDGMKIGIAILEKFYCEETGISRKQLQNIATSKYDAIRVIDCIPEFIKFTDSSFQQLLQKMKGDIIGLDQDGHFVGFDYQVMYNNKLYKIGVGGLHSVDKPGIIIPNANQKLIDCDVGSYYPSMFIKHGFIPQHLGKSILRVYEDIYHKRLEAKRLGKKIEAETLKLSLNGTFGNLINKHSWLYDPKAGLKITLNGQLMLLMLIEMINHADCEVVSANTDGITALIPLAKEQLYYDICKNWETITKMGLEYAEYEGLYQRDVNSYFALKSGFKNAKKGQERDKYVKYKGFFTPKAQVGKGLSPKVIPKTIFSYFVDAVPVQQSIKSCSDIQDFLMSQKVDKKFEVMWCGQKQQQINRFYCCTPNIGGYIQKVIPDDMAGELYPWGETVNGSRVHGTHKTINIVTDSTVMILNKLDNLPIDQRHINYRWYIEQATKLIEEMKPTQLKLF